MIWVRFTIQDRATGVRRPTQWAVLPQAHSFTVVKGGVCFWRTDGSCVNYFKAEELAEISDHTDLFTKVHIKLESSTGPLEYDRWTRQEARDSLGRRIP